MPTQLDLPLRIHLTHLHTFLDKLERFDAQLAALKDERKALIADAKRLLPTQAILTALAVVQKRRALEERADQPMKRAHQTQLEDLIERWLEGLPLGKDAQTSPDLPDMVAAQEATG